MIDENKIHYMTKIAMHKKKYNDKDIKLDNYYRSDYIYKKNIFNRFWVIIGLFFVAILAVLDIVFVKQTDIFSIDYKKFGIEVAAIALIVLVIYSFIGMIKYGIEYDLAEKRLKQYRILVRDLERYNRTKLKEKSGLEAKEESGEDIERPIED